MPTLRLIALFLFLIISGTLAFFTIEQIIDFFTRKLFRRANRKTITDIANHKTEEDISKEFIGMIHDKAIQARAEADDERRNKIAKDVAKVCKLLYKCPEYCHNERILITTDYPNEVTNELNSLFHDKLKFRRHNECTP